MLKQGKVKRSLLLATVFRAAEFQVAAILSQCYFLIWSKIPQKKEGLFARMHFSLALHPLGPGNSLYWLEQQRTRPSTRLRETQVTPLLPGIYGISFHWLLGKFWLQNRVHLEEAEWETSYSVMLQLSDLDFKSLQSRAHLQLVALLVLIILLSPSGVLLCPKRRVLFRTNNLTWQRAAEPTLLSLGCQHRTEPCARAGGDPRG